MARNSAEPMDGGHSRCASGVSTTDELPDGQIARKGEQNGGPSKRLGSGLAPCPNLSRRYCLQFVSVATLEPKLIKGWNLVALGEASTPKLFCDAQGGGVTSLWAWDATNSACYFYAPWLEAQGGTALSGYIQSNGYFDFSSSNKTLGSGTGFWVNR